MEKVERLLNYKIPTSKGSKIHDKASRKKIKRKKHPIKTIEKEHPEVCIGSLFFQRNFKRIK